MKKILGVIILSLLVSGNANASNHYPITRDSKISIARGELLYNQYCASCHMSNLSGAKNWKGVDKDGHRKAPPLNGTGHTWHHDDATLHNIIKYGLAKLVKNYEGKMLGFEDNLKDKDIDSVLSYIKSFWPDDIYQRQINLNK